MKDFFWFSDAHLGSDRAVIAYGHTGQGRGDDHRLRCQRPSLRPAPDTA